MDLFELNIDPEKFRLSNAAWNELKLNDPWSVGYVSKLIEREAFESKEQWEIFYYDSGRKRDYFVSKLDDKTINILNDSTFRFSQPIPFKELDWNTKNLNFNFGRTAPQLHEKGQILFNYLKKDRIEITLEECVASVRFRTICETWNGIIIQERNTIKTLKIKYPNLTFIKTKGDFDHKFAVDYEVYQNQVLLGAIQIKPKSYLSNLPYIERAKTANILKNESYTQMTKKRVVDIISDSSGSILNPEILKQIEEWSNCD